MDLGGRSHKDAAEWLRIKSSRDGISGARYVALDLAVEEIERLAANHRGAVVPSEQDRRALTSLIEWAEQRGYSTVAARQLLDRFRGGQ